MSQEEAPYAGSSHLQRKRTAILSADVQGYSRLMGDDEAATVRTIAAYREVMTTLIEQHYGCVVDSPGDNLLAEFASVVDAVQGAIAIQHELTSRNTELPAHRRMQFRIGINVGDVITEDGRLYGDGVNIAARIESLAAPGGICLSEAAYTQIENKLALEYEDYGEHAVKNIAKPVRVYKVLMEAETAASPPSPEHAALPPAKQLVSSCHWLRTGLALVVVLLVGGGLWVGRDFFSPPSPPPEPVPEEPSPLPLPAKPSIAVLPFTNMSGDPEQEYFSDGITDTLITDLSQIPELFVIARNSTFTYKGEAVKAREVGRELGVRYVLEGSVQKASDQVRTSADEEHVLLKTFSTIGKPVFYTSLITLSGFLTLCLSSFAPVQEFGWLSATTILVVFAGDVILLPALLASTRIITLWDLLYLKLGRDPHRTIPLFAGLRPFQAKIVTLMGKLQSYPHGQAIIRQGEMGKEMYVLVNGAAEVFIQANGRPQRIRTLSRGDVCGEMGLLRHQERTADVIATGDVEVLAVDEQFLTRLKRRYPRTAAEIFFNISKILSDRLETSEQMRRQSAS